MERQILTFDAKSAYLNGKPFYMAVGDLHYYRIYPTDWKRRLELTKDFGINVIQTYMPWNLHEPKPGEFNFDGICDIDKFLALCEELGLYVMLRPAPYICSEWDLGGLPSWLLKNPTIELRSSDPDYLTAVKAYYDRILPMIKPHLSTNGGCVIALVLENEYGSYGADKAYIAALADIYNDAGMDVPYYTTDGALHQMMAMGSYADCLKGVNFRARAGSVDAPYKLMCEIQPDKPFFSGEWWSGRAMYWGEPFSHRDPVDIAQGYREALATGGYIDFYMFSGGTNFGFMSGADYGTSFTPKPGTPSRYMAHTTSYEEDALLSEEGTPTEKYFLCRDELDDYLGRPRRPHAMPEHRTQRLTVKFDSAALLSDNLDALTETKVSSARLKTMEELDQDYGYIMYSTEIPGYRDPNHKSLVIKDVKDRALVYVGGEYVGNVIRDRTPSEVAGLTMDGDPIKLDVIVENTGRINHGQLIRGERKGIGDGIFLGAQRLSGYTIRTLPMRDLGGIEWKSVDNADVKPHSQVFYRGHFSAEAGVDTFAHIDGFGDGFVVVNGFNVGRFRACGPQKTLYIPGGLLKADNEIIVFDSDSIEKKNELGFIDHSILDAEV